MTLWWRQRNIKSSYRKIQRDLETLKIHVCISFQSIIIPQHWQDAGPLLLIQFGWYGVHGHVDLCSQLGRGIRKLSLISNLAKSNSAITYFSVFTITTVLCVIFHNAWAAEMYVMDERDFARFKMCFGGISCSEKDRGSPQNSCVRHINATCYLHATLPRISIT